ncbi:MAG TPA: cytochrome P450 [Acidimicrobiia bacterium]|nr:cytochrome P450 [Acidimicrobiia bacterium]
MARADKQPVTIDFDHHAPGHAADPYPTYAKYRSGCPVAWSEHHGGYWVLFDYASVYAAARDDDTFRSGPSSSIPLLPAPFPMIPMETDAPDTQKWRRMLSTEFTPAAAKDLEPSIYADGHALLDEVIERGECDIIKEFATPLPARVILRLLGFDPARWPEFVGWVHDIVHGMETDPGRAFEAAFAMLGEINTAIETRRQHGLTGDIVSKLMASTFDGRPVADQEIAAYVMLLIFGGLDTTTASLGNAMVRMQQQPHLRQQLLHRPELIPNAVEEFLRYDSPLQAVGRNIAKDVEMGGRCLKAGERALLVWASANRDEAQFPHADEIDFERAENRHLSFIVGLHRCLGSNLGRSMFRIMLELVLERMPDFELTGDPDDHRFADAGNVYALASLPVRFTPGRRLRA